MKTPNLVDLISEWLNGQLLLDVSVYRFREDVAEITYMKGDYAYVLCYIEDEAVIYGYDWPMSGVCPSPWPFELKPHDPEFFDKLLAVIDKSIGLVKAKANTDMVSGL